ncbi:MAG: 50S ribosomal protein L9 [Clostridia bacterium]|nr:50S ribosomal protein L9 [Clostridia bacterium]MBR3974664.1 50S ribosomal protein L9 [Clostridia bacterium]
MKVILNQDVKDLGKKGELVNVSDGYAKNFLIPRKIAVVADNAAMNELKNREASKAHHLAVEKAEAQAAADKLNGKSVKVQAKAGANGRLFGSVTSKEIAEKIKEQYNVEIDKKKIVSEDIRNYGTYECTLKIYTGITAKIFVVVGE